MRGSCASIVALAKLAMTIKCERSTLNATGDIQSPHKFIGRSSFSNGCVKHVKELQEVFYLVRQVSDNYRGPETARPADSKSYYVTHNHIFSKSWTTEYIAICTLVSWKKRDDKHSNIQYALFLCLVLSFFLIITVHIAECQLYYLVLILRPLLFIPEPDG